MDVTSPGIVVKELPAQSRGIVGLPTSVAVFIGTVPGAPLTQPVHLASMADLERIAGPQPAGETCDAIDQFFVNGGPEAWVVPVAGTSEALQAGLTALDQVERFNILCMPDAAMLAPAEMQAVYAAAESYAVSRSAMLILDVAEAIDTPPKMTQWLQDHASLRSPNAAVYFPRFVLAGRSGSVASSGTLAGLWAASDLEVGVWKAPANISPSGVSDLAYKMSDTENAVLNPLGVNAIRIFSSRGIVVWGARTLATPGTADWTYIAVRRLALHVETSIRAGAKWAAFEPNATALWASLRATGSNFLHGLWQEGAFLGTTPDEAYFVKCGLGSTMTADDALRGIVKIQVGVAAMKPAEFIVLEVQVPSAP